MACRRSAVRSRLAPPAFARKAREGYRAEARKSRLRVSSMPYGAKARRENGNFIPIQIKYAAILRRPW
jgi:hypothetical protein